MSQLRPEIYIYWGDRPESTAACAARLARLFKDWRSVHPAFAQWFHKGYNPTEWNRPLCSTPPKIEELAALYDEGRHYTDVGHELMAELGYSVYAWNGRYDDYACSFRNEAGGWGQVRYFPNNLSLKPRARTMANADFVNAAVLGATLRAIVTAWDADWGRVYDWYYTNPIMRPERREDIPPFWSGWIVYLSARFAERISVPRGIIADEIPGHGLMLFATKDVFDLDNPAHMAAAFSIQEALAPIQHLAANRSLSELGYHPIGGGS
jgi:hypothetical protein